MIVRRNSDKPHRCPRCHTIRIYDIANWQQVERRRWPLTVFVILSCEPCGVRWFYRPTPWWTDYRAVRRRYWR